MNLLRRMIRLLRGVALPLLETQVLPAELARYLPRNPVVVEAGAPNGQDTVRLAAQWPTGVVHAFEPVPQLCAALQQRVMPFSNVRCHELALATAAGVAELHLSSGTADGSSSLLAPEQHLEGHPDVQFLRTIQVRTVTLDGWAQEQGLPAVDLLWLDLQGLVLAAASDILATMRAVHSDGSLLPVYQGTMLYSEFRRWMEARDFVVAREILPYPDVGYVLFGRRS